MTRLRRKRRTARPLAGPGRALLARDGDGDAVALARLRGDGGGVHGGRAHVHHRACDANPGPPGLTVADAEVEEAANATLAFAVTLSRAPSGTVTVDYATSDGTAAAGSDYTATSGTLTFAAGETEKTVSVPVLDDAHDEGSETLTLTLSNPSGAYLADGSATGTINNTDPMPLAWMVRFGRTVGSQVVDALGQRLDGGTGSHVTVGGINLTGAPGAVPEAPSDAPFGLPDWAKRAHREESVQSLTPSSRDGASANVPGAIGMPIVASARATARSGR